MSHMEKYMTIREIRAKIRKKTFFLTGLVHTILKAVNTIVIIDSNYPE